MGKELAHMKEKKKEELETVDLKQQVQKRKAISKQKESLLADHKSLMEFHQKSYRLGRIRLMDLMEEMSKLESEKLDYIKERNRYFNDLTKLQTRHPKFFENIQDFNNLIQI